MPTIGLDCQIILDGSGYWLEPGSYTVTRPRVRRADLTGVVATSVSPGAGVGERYVDRGPGKRVWRFIVVAFNSQQTYAGTSLGVTGQHVHDMLQASYNRVNSALQFTDPMGSVWSVRFDDLAEELTDVRSQIDGAQYLLHVTLVEA